uniref:Reelin domain-containing protein n=1 Tax=Lepisosteus oculatus TaxID=7918 RepID=W5LYR9_LEPOC
MHQKTIFSLLLMNAYLVTDVFSFPNGSVAISCDSMIPGHTGYVAQTSVPPFSVTTSKSTYAPGDQITVTLETKTSVFEGFLLQARKIDGNSAVGSFISIDMGQCQGLRCNNVVVSSAVFLLLLPIYATGHFTETM